MLRILLAVVVGLAGCASTQDAPQQTRGILPLLETPTAQLRMVPLHWEDTPVGELIQAHCRAAAVPVTFAAGTDTEQLVTGTAGDTLKDTLVRLSNAANLQWYADDEGLLVSPAG